MAKRKSKYTPGNFKLSVKRAVVGRGVFAGELIPKGACILEYTGRLVTKEEEEKMSGKYLFEVNKRKTIDGNVKGNTARFINHSCKPNCEADGPKDRVFIVARRRIKAGEELTYDYGKEYFDEHLKPIGCKCSAC